MRAHHLVLMALLAFLLLLPVGLSGDSSAITVSSNPLIYVETYYDMGLGSPTGLAMSPDGAFVYATDQFSNSVAVLERDQVTGELNFVEVKRDGEGSTHDLDGAHGIAVSPDGGSIYVASWRDDALTVFSRDATTGKLTFLEVHKDGVGGVNHLAGAKSVAVTADDKNVYVASHDDDALTVFQRDRTTGALSFLEDYQDGVAGVDGLAYVYSVDVSPDGDHLYVAGYSDNAVAVFSRENSTGSLTFLNEYKDSYIGLEGLISPAAVKVSPDGKNVYVVSTGDDALVAFQRNAATGLLTFVEALYDDQAGVHGLDHVRNLTVSQDGKHVYTTSITDHSIAIFARQPADGSLSYVDNLIGLNLVRPEEVILDPLGQLLYVASSDRGVILTFDRDSATGFLAYLFKRQNADGLEGAVGLAASDDGCLYVTGNIDDSLAFFKRDPATGVLTYKNRILDGGSVAEYIDGARDVVVGSGGDHIYVAGHDDDAVTLLRPSYIRCSWVEFGDVYRDGVLGVDGLDGVQSLTLSPDGRHLYAVSEGEDAVAIFSQNASSGVLTYRGVAKDNAGGVVGLDGAYAMAITPDGNYAYVVGYEDDAVVAFERNNLNGWLTYIGHHDDSGILPLNGANDVVVTPDGNYLYVASRIDDAIVHFSIESDGLLDHINSYKDSHPSVDGLNGARAIAIPPDGRQLFVASQVDDAVAVFNVDESSGGLALAAVYRDGQKGIDGLNTANAINISPEGGHIYVSGYDDDAVVVFGRHGIYLPMFLK